MIIQILLSTPPPKKFFSSYTLKKKEFILNYNYPKEDISTLIIISLFIFPSLYIFIGLLLQSHIITLMFFSPIAILLIAIYFIFSKKYLLCKININKDSAYFYDTPPYGKKKFKIKDIRRAYLVIASQDKEYNKYSIITIESNNDSYEFGRSFSKEEKEWICNCINYVICNITDSKNIDTKKIIRNKI